MKDRNVCVCLPGALDMIFCSSFGRCPVIKTILQYTEFTDGPEQPGVKHTELRFVLPLSFWIPVYITQMQKFKSFVSQKSIFRVCVVDPSLFVRLLSLQCEFLLPSSGGLSSTG